MLKETESVAEKPKKPDKRGRKSYVVTSIAKQQVIALKAAGATNEMIAEELGLNEKTLVRYFSTELTDSREKAVQKVAGTLYHQCMQGNIAAIIFYLKCQGRWKTEESKLYKESNEKLKEELLKLREELGFKNDKDY